MNIYFYNTFLVRQLYYALPEDGENAARHGPVAFIHIHKYVRPYQFTYFMLIM